ncbi:MAG: hypothetical protein JO358_07360 [Alphaproteobacteria bacterium]|nr:hypothetical protein [Alphaproteobacteria bacterium]
MSVSRRVRVRATVIQKKTGRPVQFEITEQTRAAVGEWLAALDAREGRYLFPSRLRGKPHLSTRQYARIAHRWADRAGLDSSAYGTQILLLGIAPGNALHADLDARVLLLEEIERLAHLRALGIVEAKRDRDIRSRNAAGHEATESSSHEPADTETRGHSTLPDGPPGELTKCGGRAIPSSQPR